MYAAAHKYTLIRRLEISGTTHHFRRLVRTNRRRITKKLIILSQTTTKATTTNQSNPISTMMLFFAEMSHTYSTSAVKPRAPHCIDGNATREIPTTARSVTLTVSSKSFCCRIHLRPLQSKTSTASLSFPLFRLRRVLPLTSPPDCCLLSYEFQLEEEERPCKRCPTTEEPTAPIESTKVSLTANTAATPTASSASMSTLSRPCSSDRTKKHRVNSVT